jgi:hypothetical protein
VIPGPPKYAGKYEKPTGEVPKVTDQERGIFPAEFQKLYEAFKVKEDKHARDSADMVNGIVPTGFAPGTNMITFQVAHSKEAAELKAELEKLRQTAVKMGVATDRT